MSVNDQTEIKAVSLPKSLPPEEELPFSSSLFGRNSLMSVSSSPCVSRVSSDMDQLEHSKKLMDELENRLRCKDNEISILKEKVKELDAIVQDYAFGTAVDLLSSASVPQGSQDDIFEKVLRLEQKLKEKDEVIKEKNEEIGEMSERLNEANQRSVRTQRNKLDTSITVRLNETVGKCKELEENLEKSKLEVEDYIQKCDELQKRISGMESDQTTWSKEQQLKFETDRAKLADELHTLQDNLDQKSMELEGEASKCRKYEEDLRSKEEEWRREKEQLESTVTQKVTELHKLEENVEMERVQYKSRVQTLLQEKLDEEMEKNEYKMKATQLQEENKRMTAAYDKDQLSHKQLLEKSKKDSDLIDELRQANSNHVKKLDDRNRENKKLTERTKDLEVELRRLAVEKERLHQELQSATKDIKDLKGYVEASKFEAESNKESFIAESQAKERVGRKNKELDGRVKELEKKLQDEKRLSDGLRAERDQLSRTVQDEIERNKTLRERMDKLARDKRDLMEQLNAIAVSQCVDAFSNN